MTDYLEGALPAAEARRLERHLETCPGCTEYLAADARDRRLARRPHRGVVPAEMRDGLIAAFRDSRDG